MARERQPWDEYPERGPDNRRKATTTNPCLACGAPVTATSSRERPFCGWRCQEAWQDLSSRFARKVGPPVQHPHLLKIGPCTDWQGKTDDNGYGKIRQGDIFRLTHRVSYELAHGSVPDDKLVCHKCSRRVCVNPAHLYAGTHAENMRDLSIENSGSGSKTEWDDRLVMAQCIQDGVDPDIIAGMFGVTGETASRWYIRFRDRDRVPEDLVLVPLASPQPDQTH